MELFLLIAIGITIISFISIALTRPLPAPQQTIITEPAQEELLDEEEAKSRESSNNPEEITEDGESSELEEELLAQIA